LNTATSGPLTVGGLISGIDTTKVIEGLLALEQQKIDNIARKATSIQSQQTAFKGVEARLLALQSQMTQLAKPQNGTFDARSITVSDPDALSAAVTSSAVPGEYHLRVTQLAQAHQLASQGFDRLDSAVTHGNLSIQIGDVTTDLTVDDTNDTLQGLAGAINASGAALTATVINDGSGDDQQGYRLLLAAKTTGSANQIVVTNGLADTSGDAIKPILDVVVQAAADASITIGSGPGALTVTSASNKIDALIPGLSLSLKQSDPDNDITLTVSNDINGITQGIQGFVSAYNEVVNFTNQLSSYDSTTGRAGLLLGNVQLLSIEQQIRSVMQRVVPGATAGMNYLGALGIATSDRGLLVLDNTKLANILNGNKPGVTLNDVRKLFAMTGSSTNPGMQFVSGSAKTHASTDPYTVHITQAADQAALTAPNAVAASTVIDNTNNTLIVKVNGTTSGTLTLANGTYSRSALAQALKTAINSDTALGARDVDVALLNDKATINSRTYGAASRIEVQSGSALAALGFAGGESAQGHDVAGSFVVDGDTETANGLGQFLLGSPGNANTDGLQVRVTLTSAQVGAGLDADVSVTRGIASQLGVVLADYFDPVNGRLKTIDDGFAAVLERLDEVKTRATAFFARRQEQLQLQFSAMEKTLAQLQSAGNILTQQAASLTKK
jgi:flagellar hook-associated protein 2